MALKNLSITKYLTPAFHILFWGLIIISPYLFRNPNTWEGFKPWHYKLIINNATLALLFYFNAFVLYPKVYKSKGLVIYLLTVIAVIIALMAFSRFVDSQLFAEMRNFNKGRRGGGRGGDRWFRWYITNIVTYVFIMGISFSYRVIKDTNQLEKIRKENENEMLKSELTFLRSQVSPHFMFNVLNTLVSLARKKSDLMEPSLIQLSNLMRYMLYESNEDRIHLEQEVEYLRSYIDLQMLRFGDDVKIELNVSKDLEGYDIEPMLLIAFVENAFKHGIGMIEEPVIKIFLSMDKTKHWLEFRVENNISPQEGSKDKNSGIGLINMKRRLELLYKDRYILETRKIGNIFVSDLKVRLK
ncbi:histidine kinase [Pedobacter sp. P351]|uniref:sensor histidine kinase n=1 Tax=Pedobacter superstes TaxID=3133441 RepID=UPI0030B520C4